jgi:hypothetical protein
MVRVLDRLANARIVIEQASETVVLYHRNEMRRRDFAHVKRHFVDRSYQNRGHRYARWTILERNRDPSLVCDYERGVLDTRERATDRIERFRSLMHGTAFR